jgi:Fur family ferric uptake transcriptional regulator
MKHPPDSVSAAVEAAIRTTGGRVTRARAWVLKVLQSAQGPLSHRDIERLLVREAAREMDRVTLYRVLDWLVAVDLAHKGADRRGVFRFSVAKPDGGHQGHMHFRCTTCGGVFCLGASLPPLPALPRGFSLASAEFDIRGECRACALAHSRAARPVPAPRASR